MSQKLLPSLSDELVEDELVLDPLDPLLKDPLEMLPCSSCGSVES